ncbi:type II toxin-antitoxin system RelE/ParE family toxin [Bradyrhizobium sp. CSA112]|uniref:type II toxin-antitoxin system RelE/ParE family toxin n=1 Tax=Bradyrhizobium sp. CSA112 TaxID=2699170 RepID=UPI0023B14C1E|nr:type II toxin-antitoxin system RelE/ParE family toxin [Bradyrhizobium sp. CSA112]MDE5453085.1 type II toxin-antitoxin system RelE/ParE family toxin [Bradyrhizobium sp. CSA112]
MKLRFTPRAARNIAEIADYIREHSPQAALRVRAAILASLESLVMFPHIGRQQKIEGVRKLLTRPYPYLVYYVADDEAEEIVILAIQHPAREREHSDA